MTTSRDTSGWTHNASNINPFSKCRREGGWLLVNFKDGLRLTRYVWICECGEVILH